MVLDLRSKFLFLLDEFSDISAPNFASAVRFDGSHLLLFSSVRMICLIFVLGCEYEPDSQIYVQQISVLQPQILLLVINLLILISGGPSNPMQNAYTIPMSINAPTGCDSITCSISDIR